MRLYEYQAKRIFRRYGIPVPRGKVARTPREAGAVANELGVESLAIKAQVLYGGRGKSGGIKLCSTPRQAEKLAKRIIGFRLVTPQTGREGIVVKSVLIEEALNIKKELYIGIIIDRSLGIPVLLTSRCGGVEIEEVAKSYPEEIFKERIDPLLGILPFQLRRIAKKIAVQQDTFHHIITTLSKLFFDLDASLVEINPLAITKDESIVAIDAKINIDDSALYRHPGLSRLSMMEKENPDELRASKHGLSYVGLSGNIGCMVNGAGLAMATMDLIKSCGGEPANFLDVGGGADVRQVKEAFKIILKDFNVKAILVNIFGGIMRCDMIAQGIIDATKKIQMRVPLVVRLEGTNVEDGKKLLSQSDLNIIFANDMETAARKAVEVSKRKCNR